MSGPVAQWSYCASLTTRECATGPGGRPRGRPGDVGIKGHPLFVDHIFRACAKPDTGPVVRHSRWVSQRTMSESGRAPGLPAGPGSFFVTAGENNWVFPSFGTPKS